MDHSSNPAQHPGATELPRTGSEANLQTSVDTQKTHDTDVSHASHIVLCVCKMAMMSAHFMSCTDTQTAPFCQSPHLHLLDFVSLTTCAYYVPHSASEDQHAYVYVICTYMCM